MMHTPFHNKGTAQGIGALAILPFNCCPAPVDPALPRWALAGLAIGFEIVIKRLRIQGEEMVI